MRKSLYSTSARRQVGKTPAEKDQLHSASHATVNEPRERAWRRLYRRHEKAALVLGGALLALGMVFGYAAMTPPPLQITQDDIDQAVARTLEKKPVPSNAVRAYQARSEERRVGKDWVYQSR